MIRWITQNLGTGPYDAAYGDTETTILDVRHLLDAEGNDPKELWEVIQEGVKVLTEGRRLVVCCHMGVSRSNAIAAGILSLVEKQSFACMVRKVMESTGEAFLNVQVLEAVASVLNGGEDVRKERDFRTILVTGGSGFVGRSLVPMLEEQFRVFSPTSGELDLVCGGVHLYLRMRENGVTDVVHLADPRALYSPGAFGCSVAMLKNVVDACKAVNAFLLFISSNEVFSSLGTGRYGEMDDPYPATFRGQLKRLEENIISWNLSDSTGWAILRVPIIYSNTNRHSFIKEYYDKARQDLPITVHRYLDGYPRVDLVHMQDICRALCLILNDRRSGYFHITSGQILTTMDIALYIIYYCNSKSICIDTNISIKNNKVCLSSFRLEHELHYVPRVRLIEWIQALPKRRMEI